MGKPRPRSLIRAPAPRNLLAMTTMGRAPMPIPEETVSMTVLDAIVTRKAPFKTRYGNFIGGEWRRAGRAATISTTPRRSPASVLCEIARSDAADIELALDAAHAAKDAWGRTSADGARADPEPDRRPDGGEPRAARHAPRPGTTASRSARRWPPTCRSPSTISAISPAAIRAQEGSHRRRSTTTPSPITSTSRSASSARSSRGTSRS